MGQVYWITGLSGAGKTTIGKIFNGIENILRIIMKYMLRYQIKHCMTGIKKDCIADIKTEKKKN